MNALKIISSLFLISIIFNIESFAQLPYTQPTFSFSKDSAINFGSTTNYCGFPYELKMNVYKPKGAGQAAKRPLVIFVHGGAFISDANFNEPEMNGMAIEFAKRGYVSASIDYREGLHLKNYTTGYPGTIGIWNLPGAVIDWNAEARLFAADSAETVRAVYRAQQDVKAAIRYFKLRAAVDSVDVCAVFLAGHSAGAITILQAAFTDRIEEKPLLAEEQTTLPNPNWKNRCEWVNPFDPNDCWLVQPNGPQGRDNAAYSAQNLPGDNFENATSYIRPDLGAISGEVNLDPSITDEILGVGAMAGAIIDSNLLINTVNFPAVFLYHQPADRVVPFNRSRPFSFYNDFLSPGPNNQWPIMSGSFFIKNKLSQMNYPGQVAEYWFDNSGADPLALTSHAILPYTTTVADSMAKFFAKILAAPHNCLRIVPLRSNLQATLVGNYINVRMEILESTEQVSNLVLQKSTNGRDFINIKTFTSNGERLFTFKDNSLEVENFYRMEIISNQNKSYTNTVHVGYQNVDAVIFPNPVNGKFLNLNFINFGLAGNGHLLIKDVQGKVILKKDVNLMSGFQTQKIEVSKLPAGLYLIELINGKGEKLMNSKFIKAYP